MKLALIIILVAFIGCQDYNSNSFDKDRYGEIELSGGPLFEKAYPALQKHCMSCHRHAQWAGYTDAEDWVNNENLVVRGDPAASQVLYRIVNYGGASSDMPQGGAQIPQKDYDAIKVWVESFQ